MKEILFKAKRTDNGKWVQGNLLTYGNKAYIVADEDVTGFEDVILSHIYWKVIENRYEVDPETVGQYTGLTDKNGKKIFEGDYWIDKDDNDIFVVEFRDGQYCFVVYGACCVLMPYGYDEIGFGECDCVPMTDYDIDTIEIIGNIHDNPEILKGGVIDE